MTKTREITMTKTKTDLKGKYDPDKIVHGYYKKMQKSKLTLTLAALDDPVTDVEIMRCAFEIFEVQTDLKETCCNWDRQALPITWARLMIHFSI